MGEIVLDALDESYYLENDMGLVDVLLNGVINGAGECSDSDPVPAPYPVTNPQVGHQAQASVMRRAGSILYNVVTKYLPANHRTK